MDGGEPSSATMFLRMLMIRSDFSLSALARVAEGAGLSVAAADRVPVHGGSLRVAFRKGGDHAQGPVTMMSDERAQGLTSLEHWIGFGESAARNRSDVRGMLEELRRAGKSVAGYGAPAKGNTLLNYCGIGV